jgi:hypothetical protein
MANRIALHSDESHQDGDQFWVIAVEEGSAGYTRINAWPTLEDARRYAADTNTQAGITDADRRSILASSMSL